MSSKRTTQILDVRVIQVAYSDEEPVLDRVHRVAEMVTHQRGADLVVLPELWAPGYFTFESWVDRAETLQGPTITAMSAAAAEIGAIVHAGSILEREPTREVLIDNTPGQRGMWNTSVVLGVNGETLETYRKIHPFGFGDGEPALIDPGQTIDCVPVGQPAGKPNVILGLATCYDLRFPELFRRLVGQGVSIFAIPAAWPAARVAHWEVLGRARAIENQAFVLQCNTGGSHGGVTLGGHSQIISPTGEVLAQAGSGEEVLSAQLDLTSLVEYRREFPVLSDRRLA